MTLQEASDQFIQNWGALGSSWGINRTMAQIHALLLISEGSLSADEVMDGLKISRGNANMNLRALIDWGLVFKEYKVGERKEYFYAEKDIWRVAQRVIQERRKRELEPVLHRLKDLQHAEIEEDAKGAHLFHDTMRQLSEVVEEANDVLEYIGRAERNWISKTILKLLGKKK